MKMTLRSFMVILISLVMVTKVIGTNNEANYVNHFRDPALNTFADGALYNVPFIPNVGQDLTVRWKVEYQFYTDTHGVWYTINGSRPDGGCGNPAVVSPGTYFANGYFERTAQDMGTVDIIKAVIPTSTLPYNTLIHYAIGSWKVSGVAQICSFGAQIAYANSGFNGVTPAVYLMSDPLLTIFSFNIGCPWQLDWCEELAVCSNPPQCARCSSSHYINATLGCSACRNPVAGISYVSAVCVNSNDTVISSCAGAVTGHFVTELCEPGNNGTLGVQTVTQACTTAMAGTDYVSTLCVPGSATALGSDSDVTACGGADFGFYVNVVCNAGSPSTLGNATQTLPCTTSPPVGSYVSVVCQAGSASVVGHDTQTAACQGGVGGNYVSSLCVSGDFGTLGTDTQHTVCSEPAFGEYVSTLCTTGNRNTLGSNTEFTVCSNPAPGYFVSLTCQPGTHSSLGQNTTQQRCSTAGIGLEVSQACHPGNATTAGSDATFMDINACHGFPCGTFADCQDKAAPALNDTTGRNCTCFIGFEPVAGQPDSCAAIPSSSSTGSTGSHATGAEPPPSSSTGQGGGGDTENSTNNTPIIAGAVAGGGFLLILVLLVCVCRSRRRSTSLFKKQNMLVRGRIASEMTTQPNYVDSETLQTPVEATPAEETTSTNTKIEIN